MMSSIIKKYEGKSPDEASIILSKFSPAVMKAATDISDSIGNQLDDLLLLPYIPSPETLMLLIQPWIRSKVLTTFLREFDLSAEKSKFIELIAEIESVEKLLKRSQKGLLFLLLQTSSEPMIDLILTYLAELKIFLGEFTKLNFRNGQPHNPFYLERYALDSLFWIGKTIGLNEKGTSPTQLNQYIRIVTDRLYEEIDRDHYKYTHHKKDYIARYTQDESFYLMFIFNPHCIITRDKLRIIRDLKNTRQRPPDTI